MLDGYKFFFSSGYGSLPGSTRNSVTETTLPRVPCHSNMYGSDSDIVQKCSPDTSPLATKKWSVSCYRQSREEPNGWVCTVYIILFCYNDVRTTAPLESSDFTQNECSINIQCTIPPFTIIKLFFYTNDHHVSYYLAQIKIMIHSLSSQLAHRQSRTLDSTSPSQAAPHSVP